VIEVRSVISSGDRAVAQFGALQREVYLESDMLIPGEAIGRMLGASSGLRTNFLIVAEESERVLGGTFFHYLPAAESGFSSFMGILPEARGRGIARQLHQARAAELERASAGRYHGVFIDVVAPERVSTADVQKEIDFGTDPFARRKVFQALGFRKLELEYQQPVGGPGGGPVTTLDLLFCPRIPGETAVELGVVLETMRSYWLGWLGRERTERAVERLRAQVSGASVRLLPAA
jgi:GNAT superfamily N-acetyltransferase